MGTSWKLSCTSDALCRLDVRSALQAVFDRVVQQMSTWKPDSAISAYNRSPGGSWHWLPANFGTVVRSAIAWSRASEGAFDPTVGPLVRAWRFGVHADPAAHPGIASPDLLAAARRAVGWERLKLKLGEDGCGTGLLQPGGCELDLSGIAKGFAVDEAARSLCAAGLCDFLLEVGGELRASGHRADGSPWTIGIEALDGGAPLPLTLRDCCIATSGDGFHAFERDGRRYSHTLDPRTGEPVAHGLASVSVVHAHCMDADAIATLLTVLGPQAGPAFCERLGIAAFFQQRGPADGRFSGHATSAFERLL